MPEIGKPLWRVKGREKKGEGSKITYDAVNQTYKSVVRLAVIPPLKTQ